MLAILLQLRLIDLGKDWIHPLIGNAWRACFEQRLVMSVFLSMLDHLLIHRTVITLHLRHRNDESLIFFGNLYAFIPPIDVVEAARSSLIEPRLTHGALLLDLEKHLEILMRQFLFFQSPRNLLLLLCLEAYFLIFRVYYLQPGRG